MSETIETLLQNLLVLTLSLKQSVDAYSENNDSEEWLRILEDRQQIINQIDAFLEEGYVLTEQLKDKYIAPVYEMDQVVIPLMEQKKAALQEKMQNLNKQKAVQNQYKGYSMNAYGAFFDKKK
ncbi:flagellar protein FliT [Brevibacillus migulae]|uniref:flagellar protein FliT n=1 Tax=Brevibacillus migulae TaxID=1644114 RepID=UPI00106E5A0D|nr:flagellar protein FliT [Brevibacillus migulae]